MRRVFLCAVLLYSVQEQYMHKTCALDLATSCGWALLVGDVLTSGQVLLARPKAHPGSRYTALGDLLTGMDMGKGDRLAYEAVARHSGTRAAHVYGGLLAVVEAHALRVGCALVPVPQAHVRRQVGAHPGSGKGPSVAYALERWGVDVGRQDDRADALAVLACVVGGA